MYVQNIDFFESIAGVFGSAHRHTPLFSNGTYVRDQYGEIIKGFQDPRFAKGNLYYQFVQEDGASEIQVGGRVQDRVISERILTYLSQYYRKYPTNCSAFANYLLTGEFISCQGNEGSMVLTQNMTTYTGERILVGDMVCVLYYKKLFASRHPLNKNRKHYRESQKQQHDGGYFLVNGKMGFRKPFRPEDVRSLYLKGGIQDYHFFVCVDHYEGKPVLIQQIGYDQPEDERHPNIVLTLGDFDTYQWSTHPPCVTLIHRRNGKRK